jgi:N-methylhydantoinase A
VDVSASPLLRGAELSPARLGQERARLAEAARARLGSDAMRLRVRHELRYAGQAFELAVDEELERGPADTGLDPRALRAAFERAHEERYGYSDPQSEIELVSMRASAWGPAPALRPRAGASQPVARERGQVVFAGRARETEILRGEPCPGERIDGPALCVLSQSTLLVPPGWTGEVDGYGSVLLTRASRQEPAGGAR